MHPKIMVVEDEEALSELLRYNLEAEGFEVEVQARGDDAELRLREEVPRPVASGLDASRSFRN